MGGSLILETTFLIDLEREHHRGAPGRAVAFLEQQPDSRLYLPFVVAGELAAGTSLRDRERWERYLGGALPARAGGGGRGVLKPGAGGRHPMAR